MEGGASYSARMAMVGPAPTPFIVARNAVASPPTERSTWAPCFSRNSVSQAGAFSSLKHSSGLSWIRWESASRSSASPSTAPATFRLTLAIGSSKAVTVGLSWICGVPRPRPRSRHYITAAVEEIYTVPESVEGPRSLRLESGDRDRAGGFEPDASTGDVPPLARARERAELFAQHVDPAGLSELQRGRRGHGDPESVAAGVFGAPQEGLVVDPHSHGPRDGDSWMTTALSYRGHRPLPRTSSVPATKRLPLLQFRTTAHSTPRGSEGSSTVAGPGVGT